MERANDQLVVGTERFVTADIDQHRRRCRAKALIKLAWRDGKSGVAIMPTKTYLELAQAHLPMQLIAETPDLRVVTREVESTVTEKSEP